MNNPNWLLRATNWVRNPPRAGRVMLLVAVVAVALTIVGLEHFGLWPEWATADRARGMRLPR